MEITFIKVVEARRSREAKRSHVGICKPFSKASSNPDWQKRNTFLTPGHLGGRPVTILIPRSMKTKWNTALENCSDKSD